ncbi:MAG: leucine--tRNA ligase, partial [Gemmatimonadetes bacterium]|nr:leucine--tRNA ligase [Gemmatimonadota bacterium]
LIGHQDSVFNAAWPEFDEASAREDVIELVVQVNGRVRGRITAARDVTKDEALALALADEAVQRHVTGKEVKQVIFVPGRLTNIVLRD